MKNIRISGILALLTALALALIFAGCTKSSVPVPKKPKAYEQEKSQAMDHWREIAVDVSKRVHHALMERNDLLDKPIYVQPPNSRPFMLSFHQLLRTEMVSRAMQVSESRERDTIRLEYDVITVFHNPSRFNEGIFSRVADMGLGISNVFTGSSPSASNHEISVNVRMAYNNRYVLHLSYLRYINDADWPLYISPESQEPSAGRVRTVRVINR